MIFIKIAAFLLIPVIILSSMFVFSAFNISTEKKYLFCDKNGNFTILIVADPQCDNEKQWIEAKVELETLISRTNPDFVLINGDMNSKNKIPVDMWKMFISPITDRNLFWSTTNGNHDPYCDENYEMYKNYQGCLNSLVSRADQNFEEERPMNYVIPVYSNTGEKTVFAIYALDSGGSNKYGYEGVTRRQIAWYVDKSNILKSQNGGKAVTSLMCFHIPITQTIDMFYSNPYALDATPKKCGGLYSVHGTTNQRGVAVKKYYCQNGTYVAKSFLHTTAPQNDRGLFEKILKQGDVKALVFGHEHNTNFAGSYKGVLLAFAGKLSSGCYSDNICRGGRVIKFNQKDPENFTTQWVGSLPSSPIQPEIYADGTTVK